MVSGASFGTIESAGIAYRVNRPLIHADACAAGSACLDGLAEALNHVRFSCASLVFESHQKSAITWLIEVVVVP